MRAVVCLSVVGALGVLTPMARSEPKDAFQRKVNAAIDKGVKKLKEAQGAEGAWPHEQMIGMTALCAWTLLEGGVAKDDARVQRAAEVVRRATGGDRVYSVACAIFFLDRLGDPADVPIIEALTAQLLGGQLKNAGWNYNCPVLDEEDHKALHERVQAAKRQGGAKDKGTPKLSAGAVKLLKKLDESPRGDFSAGDNSNTQFAMMALWVARRHGLPVDDALVRIGVRFRRAQQAGGTWSYPYDADAPNTLDSPGTPAFTCAGLLALALHQGVKKDANSKNLLKDAAVDAGMNALVQYMEHLSRDRQSFFKGEDNKNYYFLWSLERMAVVYDLKTIGKRDWYDWGAKLLIEQDERGGWEGPYGLADVCFAVLFLKRANLADDLTRQLNLFNPIRKEKPPQ